MPKQDGCDELQLCAQAMCLEEMLCCEILSGALFYAQPRRRLRVTFTPELRKEVRTAAAQMHELYRRGHTPQVRPTKACSACSLKELCLPRLQKDPSGVLTSLGGNRGKRRNLPCEEGGISMNCPVCGKEMEKGHVITKNSIGLFFMPGEKDLRTFYTRRNIEADGGIVLDGPMTFRYNRTWLPAWVCRGCKKIVMEYW